MLYNVQKIKEDLFERYPSLRGIESMFIAAYDILNNSIASGGKILICGNGGSAADAEHFVGELMKGFHLKRKLQPKDIENMQKSAQDEKLICSLQKAIPAISLSSQLGLITAISNDISDDMIYAQQVYGYANSSNDVLIGLSTSGNSNNVLNAIKVANMLGLKSICITGKSNNLLSQLATICIRVPSTETYMIQEMTIPIYHALCAMLEFYFFGMEQE